MRIRIARPVSRTGRLVLAAGLLATAGTAMAAQAYAAGPQPRLTIGGEDEKCKGVYNLKFSPGIGATAVAQTITGSVDFVNCESPDGAEPTATITSVAITKGSGTLSCSGSGSTAVMVKVTWSDGTTQTEDLTSNVKINYLAPAGTQVDNDSEGSYVSGGRFTGDGVEFDLAPQGDTGACTDASPVTSSNGVVDLSENAAL